MALKGRAHARWLAVALLLSAVPIGAAAQSLTITAPSPVGSGWDKTAHAMQDALLSAEIAKTVDVLNMPGAGGTIGLAKFVKTARGDDTKLMVTGVFMVGAMVLNRSPLTFDDVTPIARLTAEPEVIVVPSSSTIMNVADLLATLRSDPTKVSWAGGVAGGVDHHAVAAIARAAGIDVAKVNYIPFVGTGEAVAALANAQVTAGVSSFTELAESIETGKVRVIAITSRERSAYIDAPTCREQGVEVDIVNWRGVVAAPGITPEQRKALTAFIERMVASPSWAKSLKARHWDDAYLSSDAFDVFLRNEQVRVAQALKAMGLTK